MAVRGKLTAVCHRLRARIPDLWDRTAVLPWHMAVLQHLRARISQLYVCTAMLYWHKAVFEGLRAWPTDHVALSTITPSTKLRFE